MDWLLGDFAKWTGFEIALSAATCLAFRDLQERNDAKSDSRKDRIRTLERQCGNLARAIAVGGELEALVSQLESTQAELLSLRRQVVTNDTPSAQETLDSAWLTENLHRLLREVVDSSFEFTDVLRRVCHRFEILPVQDVRSGQIRPRASLSLSAGDCSMPADGINVELDLFEPPLPIQHLSACRGARLEHPHWSLKRIGQELGLNYMVVKRALDYARVMEFRGVAEPFVVLRERPDHCPRWS